MLIQPLGGLSTVLLVLGTTAARGRAQDVPAPPPDPRLEAVKTEAIADVEQ